MLVRTEAHYTTVMSEGSEALLHEQDAQMRETTDETKRETLGWIT